MPKLPTRAHGVLDYVVGALLIAAPWLLGFDRGGAETWVPVILGAGAILYSLCTDYELGVARLIPMPVHLMLDIGSGILLAASPWLFGFDDLVRTPHVVLGLFEIVTALMTERVPRGERAVSRGRVRSRPSGAHG